MSGAVDTRTVTVCPSASWRSLTGMPIPLPRPVDIAPFGYNFSALLLAQKARAWLLCTSIDYARVRAT